MPKFSPKDLPAEAWQQLPGHRPYAFRANAEDTLYFRFGQGHGVYISVAPAIAGRAINIINIETSESTLVGKVPEGENVTVGRTSDCTVKIMHAIISRLHLKLKLSGNILQVEDVGSTNGTFFLNELKFFDIDQYLQDYPIEKAEERTLDTIHETFGATLDDFLRSYSKQKETT